MADKKIEKKNEVEEKKVVTKPTNTTTIEKKKKVSLKPDTSVPVEKPAPEVETAAVDAAKKDKKVKLEPAAEEVKTVAKPEVKAKTEKKPAKTQSQSDEYKEYHPSNSREYYKKGDIVLFKKVHNWLAHGEIVEAYGKIIDVVIFDDDLPYIEVNFNDHDAKRINKAKGTATDLGNETRRFLLEVSN